MNEDSTRHFGARPNTVSAQIAILLPRGSRPAPDAATTAWQKIPFWPPDVFAVAATLIERSSAYRHVIGPEFQTSQPFKDRLSVLDPTWQAAMQARAKAWAWGLLSFPSAARKGRAWNQTIKGLKQSLPKKARQQTDYLSWEDLVDVDLSPLEDDWNALVSEFADDPLIRDRTASDARWWAPAMRLLVTADTACSGIGFRPREVLDPASATAAGGQSYPTWVQLTLHASVATQNKGAGGGLPFITT